MSLTPQVIIEDRIPQRLKENPSLADDINAIIVFDISGDEGGTWVLDLTKEEDWVSTDTSNITPKTTISISDEHFVALVNKTLNPQGAAMTGKLKLKPMNASIAMKIGKLLK